ncbi:AGC family protein kinase [Tritrichomonas foetus]|uniref:AGC family protein kinase n=1 Tax=Tritrichomonas foetus TaxID=1144522 RepID=A0A1J4KUD2_9EUKA|nr:AGC family protein kinase [Tritrichomonas foetus]|eukprot:OHT14879.1 AGC family protein kinase [Tritrichomonas foetus]
MYCTPKISADTIRAAVDAHGYDLLNLLGIGGFAVAYKVFSRSYQEEFVVKVIDLGIRTPERQAKTFDSELNALVNLCHGNIISVYDHFSSDEALYIILEYCPGGNYEDLIKQNKPLKNYIPIFKQLISALQYCHSQGIVHRDIKPANILIDKYGRPKLADFGLANIITPDTMLTGMTGSRAFLAPEVWKKLPFDAKKADIWALGVTFYMMVTTECPWNLTSTQTLEETIMNGDFKIKQEFDREFIEIIRLLLTPDPDARISLETILEMSYFSNIVSGSTNSFHCLPSRVKSNIKQFHMMNSYSVLPHFKSRSKAAFNLPPACSSLLSSNYISNNFQHPNTNRTNANAQSGSLENNVSLSSQQNLNINSKYENNSSYRNSPIIPPGEEMKKSQSHEFRSSSTSCTFSSKIIQPQLGYQRNSLLMNQMDI